MAYQVRIKKVFDIGEVVRCPDIRSCSECQLRSDGTHWAYCSRIELEPLLPYGASVPAKAISLEMPHSTNERRVPMDDRDRSIKIMKKRDGADPTPAPTPAPSPAKAAVEARIPANGRCRGCSDML